MTAIRYKFILFINILLISSNIFKYNISIGNISVDDKYLAEEFLDLISTLPENIGTSDYQYPIEKDKNGDCRFSPSLQKRLNAPNNVHLKAWATFERVKKLFN